MVHQSIYLIFLISDGPVQQASHRDQAGVSNCRETRKTLCKRHSPTSCSTAEPGMGVSEVRT